MFKAVVLGWGGGFEVHFFGSVWCWELELDVFFLVQYVVEMIIVIINVH